MDNYLYFPLGYVNIILDYQLIMNVCVLCSGFLILEYPKTRDQTLKEQFSWQTAHKLLMKATISSVPGSVLSALYALFYSVLTRVL